MKYFTKIEKELRSHGFDINYKSEDLIAKYGNEIKLTINRLYTEENASHIGWTWHCMILGQLNQSTGYIYFKSQKEVIESLYRSNILDA